MLSGALAFVIRPVVGYATDVSLNYGLMILSAICFVALLFFPIKIK